MSKRAGRYWVTRSLTVVLLVVLAAAPLFVHAAQAQDGGPSIEVVSPAPGEQVTTDDIEITVKVTNFTIDCAKAGRPDEEGVGHIHAMIDGMSMAQLANFYCGETFTIPGAGLMPGKHTLIIDLATHTHLDMMETAQQVEIDFQPANAQPLPEAKFTGDPGVELVSPSDGATVPTRFTVEVKPVNFEPSAELEGKQNVPGYGHWHVFVDTPMGAMDAMDMGGTPDADHAMPDMGTPDHTMTGTPGGEDAMGDMGGMHMMAMAGMILMPGTNTFEVDLSAWGPGEHTIFVEPVQNDHTNFESFTPVEFTVTVNPNAIPTS